MVNPQEDKVPPIRHQLALPYNHKIPRKGQRTSNLSTLSIPTSIGSTYSVPMSESSCTVQREQYWMCSKRTRLEKLLMLFVFLLSVIIIGLIIALSVLASDDNNSDMYKFIKGIFHPLASLHHTHQDTIDVDQ